MARYDLVENDAAFSDPNAWLNESSGLTDDGAPGAADTAVINPTDASTATGSGNVATLEADGGFLMDALTLTTKTITSTSSFGVTLNNNSTLTVSGTVTFTGTDSFIDASSGVLTTNGAIAGNGATTGGMEVDSGAIWTANAAVNNVIVQAYGNFNAGVLDDLVNLQIGGGTTTAGAVSVQQYVVIQGAQATLGAVTVLGTPPGSLPAIEIATQATVSTGNLTGNAGLTPGGTAGLEILQAGTTLKVTGSISLFAALTAGGSSVTTVSGDVDENAASVGGTDPSGGTTTLSVSGNFNLGTGASPVATPLSVVTAGGSLFVGGVLTIGADQDWNSTLQVNDDTSDVFGTTALAGIVNTPSIVVGGAGIGTLDLEGGEALVTTATIGNGAQPDALIANGQNADLDAFGTVTVSTASATIENGAGASFAELNLVGTSQVTLVTVTLVGAISIGASSTITGTGTLFPTGPSSGASVNDGVLAADGGTLVLKQHWTGNGTFDIAPNSTLDAHKGGLDSATAAVAFDPSGGPGNVFVPNTGLMPTVQNFAPGDLIDLYDAAVTGLNYTPGAGGTGGTLLVSLDSIPSITIAFSGNYTNGQFLYNNYGDGLSGGGADIFLACYAEGTRIQTPRGSIAIENLRIGDRVVTRAHPAGAPIVWLGRRTIDCRRRHALRPVCIRAGAFAPGMPHRDLFLSPDHAVCVDGALVPVRYLLNNSTIVQVARDEVTYFHVELPAHDLLLAEGLPGETYLDTGNRAAFDRSEGADAAASTTRPNGQWAPLLAAAQTAAIPNKTCYQ